MPLLVAVCCRLQAEYDHSIGVPGIYGWNHKYHRDGIKVKDFREQFVR
jgi:hypothetical protein